jgi:hypothetical protein
MSVARLLKNCLPGALAVPLLLAVFGVSPALADSPWWHLTSGSRPSSLSPGGKGKLVLTATNLGNAVTAGELKIADKVPPGLKAVSIEAETRGVGTPLPLTCVLADLTCTYSGKIAPYEWIEVQIGVAVSTNVEAEEANEATVSGGGAAPASLRRPLAIGGEPAFGIEDYELTPENEGGSPDTQAGSHPYQVTTTLVLDQNGAKRPTAVAPPKDLSFHWPPGMIGNPTPIPRCTMAQFSELIPGELGDVNACPQQTAVGVASVTVDETATLGVITFTVPLFNLEPTIGEPARFGFYVPGGETPVIIDTSVRTGGDYGITVKVHNISQTISFLSSQVTVWGVPADPSHNASRGWGCLEQTGGFTRNTQPCTPSEASNPPPFLSLPTSCTGPLQTSVEADSWLAPTEKLSTPGAPMPAMDGCNRLPFNPSVRATPDGTAGSTPTGLNVDVHVPQDSVLVAKGLGQSNVKDISVTLPEGVALNPSGADGLAACSEDQIGFTGVDAGNGQDLFSPGLPEPFCPDASKVGTVKIKTPLLPNPLEGSVYLASQNQNPFGSLVAMYIVAQDPISGTLVKLPGEVSLSPSGQITGTFKHNPQLAFEDAELHFFGGERAPLATPARCGAYVTDATFTPWSGNEPVGSNATFNISSGPNGGPCPGGTLPFSPSLTGGTTNINAGSFSPLSTTIARPDGQQDMQSVQLHMPAGLSGLLSGVKLCPEAEANEGTCGPESLIGETTVSAGVGSDPVSVKGGRVYITEKYNGAPFGVSIVNPVRAGPLDLEHDTANPAQNPACDCVVVRAKIEVDPTTAALTITTDASGPHSIPHLIDGVPVQIQKVNVLVNRPGFTFNPTSCNPMSITGAISSDEGASAPVSVPFQVANCANLKFTPKFSVSTSAHPSKAQGASLTARLAEPAGSMGSQANISKVKVELPLQLPSQLKTLQKACIDKVFNANPALCPPESIVGQAVVHTQLLPVPLTGPAYFVSHGGEEFPSLTMVLQGYGVKVELVGSTLIRKGITSTTFRTVPDTPFESFELILPQGKYSALAANLPKSANGSFCGQKLIMPSEFIAQNGMQLKQNTQIAVTGCGLTILSHKLMGRNLTLSVLVPSAGKLKASGKGLSSVSKTAKGAGTLTLTLHAKKHGKFKTKVKLTFTPSKGARQAKALSLRI